MHLFSLSKAGKFGRFRSLKRTQTAVKPLSFLPNDIKNKSPGSNKTEKGNYTAIFLKSF
jgi:hypothetical protein